MDVRRRNEIAFHVLLYRLATLGDKEFIAELLYVAEATGLSRAEAMRFYAELKKISPLVFVSEPH